MSPAEHFDHLGHPHRPPEIYRFIGLCQLEAIFADAKRQGMLEASGLAEQCRTGEAADNVIREREQPPKMSPTTFDANAILKVDLDKLQEQIFFLRIAIQHCCALAFVSDPKELATWIEQQREREIIHRDQSARLNDRKLFWNEFQKLIARNDVDTYQDFDLAFRTVQELLKVSTAPDHISHSGNLVALKEKP